MNLYYTTTAGEDQERKDPFLSLGGYKSSTKVPNGRLNNLFGDATTLTIKNNQVQYIALFLKNETGAEATNINVYFVYSTTNLPYSKYEIAAVSPTLDSEGVSVMENVQDMFTQPYVGTFTEADGVGNAVSLGSLADEGLIGIWLRRVLENDNIDSDQANKITKQGDIYVETPLETEDEIIMNVVYNE